MAVCRRHERSSETPERFPYSISQFWHRSHFGWQIQFNRHDRIATSHTNIVVWVHTFHYYQSAIHSSFLPIYFCFSLVPASTSPRHIQILHIARAYVVHKNHIYTIQYIKYICACMYIPFSNGLAVWFFFHSRNFVNSHFFHLCIRYSEWDGRNCSVINTINFLKYGMRVVVERAKSREKERQRNECDEIC